MRILVVSTFFPPTAFGGYEVECSGVVERLCEEHEVLVLTTSAGRAPTSPEPAVRRALPHLTPDPRGALRAPAAALTGARLAAEMLRWQPDLVYVWNGSEIPQSLLRILADTGLPIAVRVCEHWFASLFTADQFLRELLPSRRGLPRAGWATVCRAVNLHPRLRLDPVARLRLAISWNSAAIARMAPAPAFVNAVLEETQHSVPRWGDLFDGVTRRAGDEREIVFVGRVTPYKGIDVAIEALSRLRRGPVPDARLTVIGPEDGDHGEQLRRRAQVVGVGPAISWLGRRTPAQTAEILAAAAALIVPSTWEEPFPLVTIEGALARVPVVASDVGGITEGMRDQDHALYFARADADGAARALARVLTQPDETRERVARAYEHAQRYRLAPYLAGQSAFVTRAYEALRRPS